MTLSYRLSLCLAGAAAMSELAPQQAFAHAVVMTAPDWCAQQLGGELNKPEPAEAKPGEFPGPKNHYKMTNMELGKFDLGREIPALNGRDVRARFWLMEPGGMIADHCHTDRPAFVYLLAGEVVETIEIGGKAVKRTIRAGQSVPEHNGTHHWWVNQTSGNVLMVAIDMPNENRHMPRPPTTLVQSQMVTVRELDRLMLREEYPHIPEVSNYKLQGRLVTFGPGGKLGLTEHGKRPGISYVISGTLLEHRSDRPEKDDALVRRPGDTSLMNENLWNWWENKSQGESVLLVVEFEDCGTCQ